MTDYIKLYDGISRVAWGYFFVYFDINLGAVSILPRFIGYLLFLSAINCLKDEERDLSLLRSLAVRLALWYTAIWLGSWFSLELDGIWQFADIIVSLVNLYFHFQLLTNIASIAAKYQPEGYELDSKLLRYRTIQTVILTVITISSCFDSWLLTVRTYVSVTILIVYVIICICLMKALFDFRKCLTVNYENDETE